MNNSFRGKVRQGKKRGKSLGFATANVNVHKKIPEGIYISKTKIEKDWFSSLTFIGKSKTFDDTNYQAETYILNFDRSIYETWITVKLLKKIRDNQKFDSVEELIKQMKRDQKQTEEYFRKIVNTIRR